MNSIKDILDPDLAEGLVALQPVLKDHKIDYSDPNSVSVRSDYVSDAKFNPRGMHHVYAITHTFLDLIQRTKLLPDSLNATAVLHTPPNQVSSFLHLHIYHAHKPILLHKWHLLQVYYEP